VRAHPACRLQAVGRGHALEVIPMSIRVLVVGSMKANCLERRRLTPAFLGASSTSSPNFETILISES
jgi:hypothetical protein